MKRSGLYDSGENYESEGFGSLYAVTLPGPLSEPLLEPQRDDLCGVCSWSGAGGRTGLTALVVAICFAVSGF